MTRAHLTRRRYSTILATGIVAGLAGCTDDDSEDNESGNEQEPDPEENGTAAEDENESGSSNETDDEDTAEIDEAEDEYGSAGVLTVILENEDGDPVSNGVEIRVMHDEESVGSVTQEVTNGVAEIELSKEGDYTVRAESLDDEFDAVEDGVTIEGDEEITLVLEGAPGDEADSE